MVDLTSRKGSSVHRTEGPPRLVDLYARAFSEFGARALWNMRQLEDPAPADALAVARQLRIEGNLAARRLAEQIEQVARADL